jgi:pimeloyl-ACP methyl ester carboxylesterase
LNKKKEVVQAVVGILCLVAGAALTLYPVRRYSERRLLVDAAACRMDLQVVTRSDLAATPETGAVVLLHGISANRMIMQYLARSFAELGLRVYVPDLPGHGRSLGPFTPEKAEGCSLSLVRGLAARGLLVPERTILAGHSMGGAIALRIAERVRPAGVIAISPAPMQEAHGVITENLLFHGLPQMVPNTRILVGQLEAKSFVDNAADFAERGGDSSVQFTVVPRNTHVSMLFSPTVARESQAWAAKVLALPGEARLPSRGNLAGCILGLVGLLLLSGPFLREMTGKEPRAELGGAEIPRRGQGAIEVVVWSVAALYLLRYWVPLRILHLFDGDYLASFFLVVGLGLILLDVKAVHAQIRTAPRLLFGAAFAAALLHFLITGWFELTATEAWLTVERWERFPLFFAAAFLFLFGVELLAGPVRNGRARYGYWLLLMALAWVTLASGVLYLKSGEILLVLLSPYFALQLVFSGLGTQLVHRQTGSAAAAAVFGAILLAGFCLVLFPLS